MKIGIIGCGAMGYAHAAAYNDLGHSVYACCDADQERAERFGQAFKCTPFTNIETMLSKCQLDGASICTPASHHLNAITLLAEAKIGILCEKPFVTTIDEAFKAKDIVRASRVPFRIGFKMRYEPVYSAAKTVIDSGEIGTLRYLYISHYQPLSEPAWYMDRGIVSELLVHSMDIACYFMASTPTEISMRSEFLLGKTGEDQAEISLEFSEKRRARIVGGYMANFPQLRGKHDFLFQAVGSTGYVCGKRNSDIIVCSPQRIENIQVENANAFVLEIQDFLSVLKGNRASGATLEDAVVSQYLLDAAFRSRAKNISITT